MTRSDSPESRASLLSPPFFSRSPFPRCPRHHRSRHVCARVGPRHTLFSRPCEFTFLITSIIIRRFSKADAFAVVECNFERPREYVAQENASAYFPLLEVASSASASASLPSDPDELYDKVFDMVDQNGFLSSFAALQLYKSSLSLHTHAPAVQAYYHLYDTTVVPALNKSRSGFDASCAVWVEWQQRQYCSFDAFKKAASGTKSKVVVPVYSFDHAIYPRNVVEAEAPVAVVYADIFAPTFASFHGSMVDAVNELGVAYVLRYRTPVNGTGEPLFLSGYGVELWIKKTDYKVIDDRKVVFPGEFFPGIYGVLPNNLLTHGLQEETRMLSSKEKTKTTKNLKKPSRPTRSRSL